MELMLIVGLFLALDVVALRWGADSRQLDYGRKDPRSGWFGDPREGSRG